MKRIYIAGKITGECETPELMQKCIEKFNNYGFSISKEKIEFTHGLLINKDFLNPRQSWEFYMKNDIATLMLCDEIHMLPDWYTSKGASIERQLAEDLGIKIVYVK